MNDENKYTSVEWLKFPESKPEKRGTYPASVIGFSHVLFLEYIPAMSFTDTLAGPVSLPDSWDHPYHGKIPNALVSCFINKILPPE
jgi:hypothetical protein